MTAAGWAPILYSRRKRNDFSILAAPAGLTHEELSWFELACGAATRGARFEAGGRPATFRRGALTVFGTANTVRATTGDAEPVAWLGGTENFWFAGFCSRDVAATLPDSYELTHDDLQPHLELLRSRWDDARGDRHVGVFEPTRAFASTSLSLRNARTLNGDPRVVHLWPDTPSERDELWAAAIAASHLPDRDFALYLGLLTRRDALQVAPDGGLLGRVFNATVREIAGPVMERLLIPERVPVPVVEPEPAEAPARRSRRSRGIRRLATTVGLTAAGTVALATRPKETIAVGALTTIVLGVRKLFRSRRGAAADASQSPSPVEDLARAYRRRTASPRQSSEPPAQANHDNGEDDWK